MDADRKVEIRRYAVKLRFVNRRPVSIVLSRVKTRFGVDVSVRTLQRWVKRYWNGDWDFTDKSRRPRTIHRKINAEIEGLIVNYRGKTGYEPYKIKEYLRWKEVILSESSIKRVLRKYSLQRDSKMKGQRLKWVRWQRDTPNSLWQMDHTEEDDGGIRLPVLDDCSRYLLAIVHWDTITTGMVTELLDELIRVYGAPRQILTDNGAIYRRKFDRWCRRRKIMHIRSGINKPTTVGKVEKLHDTYQREIGYCIDDEDFRYRYNTMRPHRSLHGKTPSMIYNEFHRLLLYKPWKKKHLIKRRQMC